MPNEALYVYGVVKFGVERERAVTCESEPLARSFTRTHVPDLDWREAGINGKNVNTISENSFSALVHNCEEKPYISEEPNKIKELIIAHNKVLDNAMKHFDGVIPLHFNTIIKKGENSSQDNLKKWINDNKERLEKIWNKIESKKEYGIRIYYDKEKLVQEVSSSKEIENIQGQEGKSVGLSYLLQSKAKNKINEIVWDKVNELKNKFYSDIKKVTNDLKINPSRIFIDEEKDLLLSLSILVDERQMPKIKRILEQKVGNDFSFQLTGPFAPYSFVDDEK